MADWSLERDLPELELAQATATKPAAHHRMLPSLPLACPGCWMDQRVDQMDRSSGWAILWVEGGKPATMADWSWSGTCRGWHRRWRRSQLPIIDCFHPYHVHARGAGEASE